MTEPIRYEIRALTDVWTGDANCRPDRTIPSGLLGSIRWWYEVLVRGLGGSACDPSQDKCLGADTHCVVCELFGCTGWARKFGFSVRNADGSVVKNQIRAGNEFILEFVRLRNIFSMEELLLDLTLRLIAEYGAIGGKTVYKPSDERSRASEPHHKDFGLIEITGRLTQPNSDRNELETFVRDRKWKHVHLDGSSWASLANFWFVNNFYLTRTGPSVSTFNRVLGLQENKQAAPQGQRSQWLAGSRGSSKAVFSFKSPASTFGFVNPQRGLSIDEIVRRLEQVWSVQSSRKFVLMNGTQILDELYRNGGHT